MERHGREINQPSRQESQVSKTEDSKEPNKQRNQENDSRDTEGLDSRRRTRAKELSERQIVGKVMDYSRSKGWWTTKIHGSAFQAAGIPDILCIRKGAVVWIECKRPGQHPTKIQLHRMRELEAAGCRCVVATCVGEIKEYID